MATPTSLDRKFLQDLSEVYRSLYAMPGNVHMLSVSSTQKFAQLKPMLADFQKDIERARAKFEPIRKLAERLENEK